MNIEVPDNKKIYLYHGTKSKELCKGLIHILENEYKDTDADVLSELINKKGAENKNECSIEKYKYGDDELYYIDKLVYTPSFLLT